MEEHPTAGGHNYAGGIVLNSSSAMASKVCVKECPSGFLQVDELDAKTKRIRRKCEPCRWVDGLSTRSSSHGAPAG